MLTLHRFPNVTPISSDKLPSPNYSSKPAYTCRWNSTVGASSSFKPYTCPFQLGYSTIPASNTGLKLKQHWFDRQLHEAPAATNSDAYIASSEGQDKILTVIPISLDEVQEGGSDDAVEHDQSKLAQEELERKLLKERVAQTKRAMASLETKIRAMINRVKGDLAHTDVDLHEVERSLYALKWVKVQYKGDGESVELAGSFNNWHPKFKMEATSRAFRLWSTVLYLYPGVYEIKFFVDGHWTLDPEREAVGRDSTHCNVLRVY